MRTFIKILKVFILANTSYIRVWRVKLKCGDQSFPMDRVSAAKMATSVGGQAYIDFTLTDHFLQNAN